MCPGLVLFFRRSSVKSWPLRCVTYIQNICLMLFSCNASHSGTSMPADRQSSFCNSFDFFVRSVRLQAIQAPCFSRSCVTDLLLRYSSAGCLIRFVARVVPAQHTSYIYIMLSVKICAVRETAAIMYLLQLLCFHYPAPAVIMRQLLSCYPTQNLVVQPL